MTKKIMDPRGILNETLVNLALDLATPTIEVLFKVEEPATVWGPEFIIIAVVHPVLPMPIFREIGKTEEDREKYKIIALWKAITAQEKGKPTSELVFQYPWDLGKNDYLYPGGVVAGNLGVGGSGIIGFADEGAANVVLGLIMSLSKLKREQLRDEGLGQLV